MQGLEHFSNPSVPLTRVLAAFPDGVPERNQCPIVPIVAKRQRYGNGIVLRAVRRVLVDVDEPVSAAEVQTLTEAQLGEAVSIKTVRSCLKRDAREPEARLVRVSIGRYRPARA
jgi:hypothetical protein